MKDEGMPHGFYPRDRRVIGFQDVNGLVEASERTGKKLSFEVDERGLTIFGYK